MPRSAVRIPLLKAAAFLLLALAMHQVARASCKTPVPAAELQPLDASVDSNPERAIADARSRLRGVSPASAAAPDALWNGQLQAIIADAYDTLNDDVQARVAVDSGRESLAVVPADSNVSALLLRLQLVLADTAQDEAELTRSVASLNDWEPRLAANSLGRACLLLVRSRVEGRLKRLEDAARDGLLAHRIAIASGSGEARAETGFQLITTFRRAGLYDDALRLADEVINYTRQHAQQAMLANALYAKGQTLGELRRYPQATPVLDESRALSVALNDRAGIAFTDNERCKQLVEQHLYASANTMCRSAYRAFLDVGRKDQALAAAIFIARIDLASGDPLTAESRLSKLLANGESDVPPVYLPGLYRTLAESLGQLHRSKQAYTALQKSVRLAESADERQHSLAVALLNAREQTAANERQRHALESEIAAQRALASSRRLTQRLAIWLAGAGILLSALFFWLLVASRRHSRALRQQQMILREMSDNAPDAQVLLDPKARVRFANRALFGEARAPATNEPLAGTVPADARHAVEAAVADMLDRRRPTAIDVTLPDACAPRHFELRGVPILDGDRMLGATLRSSDVTELRNLEREVLDIASRERHRLSSDLHEGLGQELTGISLLLRGAANGVAKGSAEITATLAQCITHVGRAIAVTRDLARGLSPVHIEHGSLSAALTRLAADADRRYHLTVKIETSPDDIAVSDTVADHVYLIAQEAITNAARHSECSQILIELSQDAQTLCIAVEDNGIGFDVLGRSEEGLGMRMMRYRARQLGGHLTVDSPADKGTRVALSVPRSRLTQA